VGQPVRGRRKIHFLDRKTNDYGYSHFSGPTIQCWEPLRPRYWFAPAVPANVTIKVDLYVNSDLQNIRTVISTGVATPGGIFGAAQGMKTLPLDASRRVPCTNNSHVLGQSRAPVGVCDAARRSRLP